MLMYTTEITRQKNKFIRDNDHLSGVNGKDCYCSYFQVLLKSKSSIYITSALLWSYLKKMPQYGNIYYDYNTVM